MQRALAAKSVAQAQTGLMVGGLIKYLWRSSLLYQGIALYGIFGDGLGEPDLAFPLSRKNLFTRRNERHHSLWALCFLNEHSRFYLQFYRYLWSTDIYARYLQPNANDSEKISAGRKAISI